VCPVAVVSGRDLDDVRHLVGVEGIHYAGSHGFDVVEADGQRHRKASEFRPDLGRAADELDRTLDDIPGAFLERKAFALAVHYRMLEDPRRESDVERAVDRVVADEPRLRKTGGKKIFEVRPDVEWDKGKAVVMMAGLIEAQEVEARAVEAEDGRRPGVVPLYIGDDLTDEDAFRAIADHGVGVVVRGEDDDRKTAASYVLADPSLVREFLERLAEELKRS
ncbi:MAG: trehalose-phosphatase, partial [Gemmatimonadota bacterium]